MGSELTAVETQVEAKFYKKLDDDSVHCRLCPQHCLIRPGKVGFCFIRLNDGGRLVPIAYGRVTSAYLDPIEKKPLYHFYPRSTIFSLGSLGCNLRCPWCQNWNIAQPEDAFPGADPVEMMLRFTDEMSPKAVVDRAEDYRSSGCIGVAYTYNEPFIWYEYVYDTSERARQAGLKNVLVTNGYVEEEPLKQLLPLIDAMNVDLKGFSDDFYRHVKGRLAPVIRTAELGKKAGCHIEITNLIIPGLNDSIQDLQRLVDWVADKLGEDTPIHFSRYYPSYKYGAEPTPRSTLQTAEEIAKKKLRNVYLGNI